MIFKRDPKTRTLPNPKAILLYGRKKCVICCISAPPYVEMVFEYSHVRTYRRCIRDLVKLLLHIHNHSKDLKIVCTRRIFLKSPRVYTVFGSSNQVLYTFFFFGGGGGVIASVLRYYLIEKGPSQHIALWALILSQHCQMFIQLFLL
jgi:hypothetical protein